MYGGGVMTGGLGTYGGVCGFGGLWGDSGGFTLGGGLGMTLGGGARCLGGSLGGVWYGQVGQARVESNVPRLRRRKIKRLAGKVLYFPMVENLAAPLSRPS